MKAIETYYKGYRFRSRLEARWAVFFEEVGLVFHYEYEGFVLVNGSAYLPDFWLPKVDIALGDIPRKLYFEVKPKADLDPQVGWNLINFAKGLGSPDYLEDGLLVCFGDPWLDTRIVYLSMVKEEEYYVSDCKFAVWHEGNVKKRGIAVDDFLKTLLSIKVSEYDFESVYSSATQHPDLIKAYQKARSERFGR